MEMTQMDVPQWTYAVLLGLGLAASTGLNTFLPLLMLAAAARFGLAGVDLNGSFAWLSGDVALVTLGLATVAEIAGDKIPAVDHVLDVVGTVARPVAGTVAAASVLNGADPATAAILGLIIGAPTSFGFHAAKAGTRAASSVATLGVANPVLSVLEDISSFFISIVSLLAPLLVPLLLAIFGVVTWKIYKTVRKNRPVRSAHHATM